MKRIPAFALSAFFLLFAGVSRAAIRVTPARDKGAVEVETNFYKISFDLNEGGMAQTMIP